jgi:tetratricopeptide (TPR) repeat protein
MHQEILRRKEKTLGEDHISTLDTVKHLAGLYRSQGRLAEAETMYERALNGETNTSIEDNLSTLHTANILGVLYAKRKRLADSKAMFLRAAEGYAKILGPNEILFARAFCNLGTFFMCKGKIAEQLVQVHQPSTTIKEPVLEPVSIPKSFQIPSSLMENLERLTKAEADSIPPHWEYLLESDLLFLPMIFRKTENGGVDVFRCSPNASKGNDDTNVSATVKNYLSCCMEIYPGLLQFSN